VPDCCEYGDEPSGFIQRGDLLSAGKLLVSPEGRPPAHQTFCDYSHTPHNDVPVNDGPHTRRWSHKIIILCYNTVVLQLPTVFSTVTCCTGRGELSYLAPLGSENISAPYFKQCFFRGGGGRITPQTESNTTPPSPKTEITNILFYILN